MFSEALYADGYCTDHIFEQMNNGQSKTVKLSHKPTLRTLLNKLHSNRFYVPYAHILQILPLDAHYVEGENSSYNRVTHDNVFFDDKQNISKVQLLKQCFEMGFENRMVKFSTPPPDHKSYFSVVKAATPQRPSYPAESIEKLRRM